MSPPSTSEAWQKKEQQKCGFAGNYPVACAYTWYVCMCVCVQCLRVCVWQAKGLPAVKFISRTKMAKIRPVKKTLYWYLINVNRLRTHHLTAPGALFPPPDH